MSRVEKKKKKNFVIRDSKYEKWKIKITEYINFYLETSHS
jgi:hypothetical protein